MHALHRPLASLLLATALLVGASAPAQLNTWQGPAGGSWDADTNWSLGQTPGPGQYVLITPELGAVVQGPVAPASIELLGIHAPVSGKTSLVLQPGGDLDVTEKLLVGPRGRLEVADGTTTTSAETIIAGELVLSGAATVESAAQLLNAGTIELVPGASAHIAGGPLMNRGTLRAALDEVQTTLTIDGDLLNTGTLDLIATNVSVGGDIIHVGVNPVRSFFVQLQTAGMLANLGSLELPFSSLQADSLYNTGSISDSRIEARLVVNEGRINLLGLNGSTIVGDVVNRGLLSLFEGAGIDGDAYVTETGTLTITERGQVTGRTRCAGLLVSGSATFETIELGPTASYSGAYEGSTTVVRITGDLLNSIELPNAFHVFDFDLDTQLEFRGGTGTHVLSHPGADLGPIAAGYTQNFVWPRLKLATGESLVLEDGNATPGVGLYVRFLELEGGVAQIASITGNGANIYYEAALPQNAYLGGLTHPLAGGGAIVPVP